MGGSDCQIDSKETKRTCILFIPQMSKMKRQQEEEPASDRLKAEEGNGPRGVRAAVASAGEPASDRPKAEERNGPRGVKAAAELAYAALQGAFRRLGELLVDAIFDAAQ